MIPLISGSSSIWRGLIITSLVDKHPPSPDLH
jgi:hypothetical protein